MARLPARVCALTAFASAVREAAHNTVVMIHRAAIVALLLSAGLSFGAQALVPASDPRLLTNAGGGSLLVISNGRVALDRLNFAR